MFFQHGPMIAPQKNLSQKYISKDENNAENRGWIIVMYIYHFPSQSHIYTSLKEKEKKIVKKYGKLFKRTQIRHCQPS